MWITNAPIADLAVVWAKTEEGIRGFIVEKGMRGFAAPEIERKFSLRASATAALSTSRTSRAGGEHAARAARSASRRRSPASRRRATASPGASIGAAQACLDAAARLHADRVLFGRPLAANQAIQIRLAEMARGITRRAAHVAAARAPQGRGQAAPDPGLAREVEQLPHGARHRPRRARHAGRLRHQRRVRRRSGTCSTSRA